MHTRKVTEHSRNAHAYELMISSLSRFEYLMKDKDFLEDLITLDDWMEA